MNEMVSLPETDVNVFFLLYRLPLTFQPTLLSYSETYSSSDYDMTIAVVQLGRY